MWLLRDYEYEFASDELAAETEAMRIFLAQVSAPSEPSASVQPSAASPATPPILSVSVTEGSALTESQSPGRPKEHLERRFPADEEQQGSVVAELQRLLELKDQELKDLTQRLAVAEESCVSLKKLNSDLQAQLEEASTISGDSRTSSHEARQISWEQLAGEQPPSEEITDTAGIPASVDEPVQDSEEVWLPLVFNQVEVEEAAAPLEPAEGAEAAADPLQSTLLTEPQIPREKPVGELQPPKAPAAPSPVVDSVLIHDAREPAPAETQEGITEAADIPTAVDKAIQEELNGAELCPALALNHVEGAPMTPVVPAKGTQPLLIGEVLQKEESFVQGKEMELVALPRGESYPAEALEGDAEANEPEVAETTHQSALVTFSGLHHFEERTQAAETESLGSTCDSVQALETASELSNPTTAAASGMGFIQDTIRQLQFSVLGGFPARRRLGPPLIV